MRCPECHAPSEPGATACTNCGLLLLNVVEAARGRLRQPAPPRSDHEDAKCRFCGGSIAPKSIRCMHCSEVLDEDFYRERAQRLRSRVNYASWVAYLFGLGALLVFRPVGIVSIAAGLLLSIAYYAIPVEPPSASFGTLLRRQFKFERVAIALPAFRHKRLVFVGTPLVAALIGYSANLLLLQQPVNDILRQNAALRGMKVSAHYEYWVVPGVIVYDLEELSVQQTPIDVHTAFLEFAKKLKAKRYSRVDLSYRGTKKFSIDGASFARLGEEYAKRNFDYVLYSFPRLFRPAEGIAPLNPSTPSRDALLEFHRQWYGEDPLTRTVRNAFH
jgi:hypothetical protein